VTEQPKSALRIVEIKEREKIRKEFHALHKISQQAYISVEKKKQNRA
jgi:hypothetical protein